MKDLFIYLRNTENIPAVTVDSVTGIIIADYEHSSSNHDLNRDDIRKAVSVIHACGRKAVVKTDRLFSEGEMAELHDYLEFLQQIGTDAIIYTDLGIKMILDEEFFTIKGIYAPETLLTDYRDIKVLRDDGFDGCVISKDIPLTDVYDIISECPDYCYLRVHGPILIAYSRRRYISSYLKKKNTYLDSYYLQEESRQERLPIVEKECGSWLYDACLQSLSEINRLFETSVRGLIIDNIYMDDEYTMKTADLYDAVMNDEITPEEAVVTLKSFDSSIRYTDINDLRETQLDKENQ
ncbi:MAG: U32 family peptidase [Erysipelotrichaceae bacterium]|nr:U32 family peptidase [Erysipelotrichaceae bacterium]